jgi:hypothetical protein
LTHSEGKPVAEGKPVGNVPAEEAVGDGEGE